MHSPKQHPEGHKDGCGSGGVCGDGAEQTPAGPKAWHVPSSAGSFPPLVGDAPQVPAPVAQVTASSSGGDLSADTWAGRVKSSPCRAFQNLAAGGQAS